MPDLGEKLLPRSDLTAYEANTQPITDNINQNWWRAYNDTQLNSLIESALLKSPTIFEAASRIEKANAFAMAAGAPLLPSMNLDGTISKLRQSYNYGSAKQFVPQGFQDNGKVALNFDYELDFWGKNGDRFDAATLDAKAAEFNFAQAKIMLSTSIAEAYANLANLYEKLETAKESLVVREHTKNLFAVRHKNGLENESSFEQAQSNYAITEAEIAYLQEQIKLLSNELAELSGNTPEYAIKITQPAQTLCDFSQPAIIPADLISRRPDIMAAKMSLEAEANRINIAKAGFFPNINLTGYLGYQSLGLNKLLKSDSLIGNIGPAIHLPIFDSGRIEGNYRAAYAEYNFCLAIYEKSILQALKEVANALDSTKYLQIRHDKIKSALTSSEKAYSLAKQRYEGGLATYLEVLRAEDSLISVRKEMADIKSRKFVLHVALIKAIGGGFKVNLKGEKNVK